MDMVKLKAAYQRLESLDERLTYKVRTGAGGLNRLGLDQLEQKHRHLADFTIELKEILEEVILAVASRPAVPSSEGPRET